MANTTNLNMVKPAGTDHALVAQINSNMDIIDGAVGALPSGKTLQGQIDDLEENATTYDVGTVASQAAIESALSTLGATLANSQVKDIRFTLSASAGVFDAVTYIGRIMRYANNYYGVEVLGNFNPTEFVQGTYVNGTWSWNNINRKIAQHEVLECPTNIGSVRNLCDLVGTLEHRIYYAFAANTPLSDLPQGLNYYSAYIEIFKPTGVHLIDIQDSGRPKSIYGYIFGNEIMWEL